MISNSGEAPTIETPAELPENPDSVEYEIDDDSKIKISIKEETIYFNVTQISLIPRDYKACFTVEQLCDINKFFLNFQDAKEIVIGVLKDLEQKTANIKFIDDKCIIQMINPITKSTFEINLNLEEKDTNSRVGNLENYIVKQNKKIINLEEKVKTLENIIFEYKKKKEEKIHKFFPGSEILNLDAKKLLLSFLPRKPNTIRILMNSNTDGDSISTFYNKCGGRSNTLSIIKTTKDHIFGGYTTQSWRENYGTRKVKTKKGLVEEKYRVPIGDGGAFVFSIDKKKKYNIIATNEAIGMYMNSWWGFGYNNQAINIKENCTKRNDNYAGNGTYNIPEKFELNEGENNFTVKSFEIYQVEY